MTRFAGRYAFVGGLHRTGTSLLANMIATHPQVRAITGAPVPENEGCYLQGAIAHTALHGVPGHYATDLAQHLVEGCRYDTLETRRRIEADWSRWFEPGGDWRVEKSPVNLTRMRLYQQLFPCSQFIVILRHPAIMAAALAKWVDTDPARLIDYALDAYDIVAEDLRYLHGAMVVRYEDLVAGKAFAAVLAFLGLEDGHAAAAVLRNGNADYPEPPRMSATQAARAARYGYAPDGAIESFVPIIRHPLRTIRESAQALAR